MQRTSGGAGGGGGASDVRQGGSALSNRVVVAGGGGGGSAIEFQCHFMHDAGEATAHCRNKMQLFDRRPTVTENRTCDD
jgi:Glycine rich protein